MKNKFHASVERIDLTSIVNDIWHSLRRRWWLVLITMAVVAGLFSLYVISLYEPMYRSSATFAVNAASDNESSTTDRISTSFPYIIQSDAMQQIIADDLGVDEVPGEIYTSRTGETNMFTITVDAGDADTSYAILTSILEHYNDVSRMVLGEIDITVLENSGKPDYPYNRVAPRRAAETGALAALLLWIVYFGVHSALKKTIRSEEELKRYLNLKCLSEVPLIRGRSSKSTRLTSGMFDERIRTLRTRIERECADTGAKVFLVTSALAGEGKTTISVNLALSLVGKGRRVAIVDMDLRKPSISKVIEKHSKWRINGEEKGIGDILRGEIDLASAIISMENGKLLYLPAGKTKTSVIRAINDKRLDRIFTVLRNVADYVIIDTPPSSQVSDASALVRYADSGIFVIRQDYAPLEYIREGINILDDTGLNIVGCVLNQTVQGIMDIASGYRNYGYGYGNMGPENESKEQ